MFLQRSCSDSCPFVMFVRRSFLIAGRTHHEHITNPTRIFTNHYERLRIQHGQTQTFLNFTRISPIIWRIVRNVIRIRSRMNKNKQELTSHQYELIGIRIYHDYVRICHELCVWPQLFLHFHPNESHSVTFECVTVMTWCVNSRCGNYIFARYV